MAKKTKGTQLYFLLPSGVSVSVVGCATGITGLSSPRGQIDVTCLEATAKMFEPDDPAPAAMSLTINFDQTDASHVALWNAWQNGTTGIQFAIGLGDGTAAPTKDSAGALVLPSTRTFISFSGYVADVPVDFAVGAVQTSSVSIQISGAITLTVKTP